MLSRMALSLLLLLPLATARGEAPPDASARLFDTGTASPTPVAPDALAKRAGWAQVEEGKVDHTFKGDAVAMNNCLALVLRREGRGAEVYALAASGARMLATLRPAAETNKAGAVKVVKNAQGIVALETVGIQLELGTGQPFVKTTAIAGTSALRIEAPCRFAVMPDFFADDMVVDATAIPAEKAELPFESFLLHFLGQGDAILVAVSPDREEDSLIELSGQGAQRVIAASTIPYGESKTLWLAAIADRDVWHARDVAKAEADQVVRLDWKAPFPALWRVDWRTTEGLTDSWEMLAQMPDGNYDKLDWFGQSDRYGTPDWMKANRQRWTTVLGTFQYPCWVDREGQGFLQPLKKVRFEGPALVYPIDRRKDTPLDRFAFVDVVRQTLGVGPCEYILDVEGQKKKSSGRPTCYTRSKLTAIYAAKQQKAKQAEVEQALDDVLAFVRRIRDRIEAYAAFGHQVLAYLDEQKKAKPELADFLGKMDALTRRIDAAVGRRKGGIRTPEDAAKLVEEFRTTLVGYEGDDALDRCKKITNAIVGIGGSQDELVGECRVAVKILRQSAGLAMAADPRTADVAREIRRRTREILRNPTGYEAPRH